MRIALLGYGKMGKEIETIALKRNHTISFRINRSQLHDMQHLSNENTDVVIEFTQPDSAFANIEFCLKRGIPVVCGTTGWLQHFNKVKGMVLDHESAFFYASNFSIGVNLFFKLNEYLAGLMKNHPEYFPTMQETHHANKKDAPSGTSIHLAEGLIKAHGGVSQWVLDVDERKEGELPIDSIRIGEVPGTHIVFYTSETDEIKISHEAYNRKGFAEGAVHAATWLIGKKGVFDMKDMLNSDER